MAFGPREFGHVQWAVPPAASSNEEMHRGAAKTRLTPLVIRGSSRALRTFSRLVAAMTSLNQGIGSLVHPPSAALLPPRSSLPS